MRLDEVLDGLLAEPAPLHALQAAAPAVAAEPAARPIGSGGARPDQPARRAIDANSLVQPLVDGIDRIKEQVPVVIAQLEAAFDEVLRAFPNRGVSAVSGSVSASASVG